ncbi:MAG: tetratricopeptide repeat protein [Candidatus Krumholzibacteriota bacterium]|nr:tetratricopeptide repeat protein [Candidatus Krumholzibacteriota bacterium]
MREDKKRLVLIICMLIIFLSSCVYFNTLYNARRIYSDTEEKRLQSKSSTGMEKEYQRVVVKCSKILQNNPDSGWADDAAFLLGKALFRQGKYNESAKKFEEILDNWPEEKYAPLSLFWLGKIYLSKEEFNKALEYTARFIKKYPEHEIRFQVMLLAGEISLKLDRRKEALEFYSKVIREADSEEVVEKATAECADLYFLFEEWKDAARFYEKMLHKGISWEKRYNFSLSLGECYTKLERCREAIDLYDKLFDEVIGKKEKAPVLLGKAAGYVCIDSVSLAKRFYEDIIGKYPKTLFSAEACYHLGMLFHAQADSLEKAKEYFSKVGKEAPESQYATEALKKSNSIGRLLELENEGEKGQTDKQKAKKKFYSAELQLSQFGNVEKALRNYRVVLDSFPEIEISPRAAYAIGWIYQEKLKQNDKAVKAYREVILSFPRSVQALGAIEQIEFLGDLKLMERLQGYVDSVRALKPDTSLKQSDFESSEITDSSGMLNNTGVKADSTGVSPDTSGTVIPESADKEQNGSGGE